MKHESKFLISLLLILLLKLIITIHTSKTVSKTIKLHHSNKQFPINKLIQKRIQKCKKYFSKQSKETINQNKIKTT